MARKVQVNPGVTALVLPDGNLYNGGAGGVEVILSNDEFARLRPSLFTDDILDDLGPVADPDIDASFATDADVAPLLARTRTTLETPLLSADHVMHKVLGGTFVPVAAEVEVDVAWSGKLTGVGHVSSFFAWNQTVAPGAALLTGEGFLGSSHVAGTSLLTIGPGTGPGNTGMTGRRLRVAGLIPGQPVTWEVEIGATGYYEKINYAAGNFPVDLALSNDSRTLYVSMFNGNKVVRYDPGNRWMTDGVMVEKSEWAGHSGAYGLAMHPTNNNLMYISRFGADQVVEVNRTTGAVLRTFTVDDPLFLCVSSDATKLFCVRQGALNSVVPVTLSSGSVGSAIAVGASPWKPVARGDYIYLACAGAHRVDRIHVGTHAVTSLAMGVNSTPNAVALDPDGQRLWVLEKAVGFKRARAISTSTFTFTGDTPVTGLTAGSPNDIAVSPSGRSMMVAGSASGNDLETYVLPAGGTIYEYATSGDMGRLAMSREGDIFGIDVVDAGSLQHWHAARLEIDPADNFWGGFMEVSVTGASAP